MHTRDVGQQIRLGSRKFLKSTVGELTVSYSSMVPYHTLLFPLPIYNNRLLCTFTALL